MRRTTNWIAALLVASLVAAGCGDDDEGAQTADEAGADTPAQPEETENELTGDPIKIGVVGMIEGAVAMPWVQESAEVAAAAVNADGGIDGRPVEVLFCDHKGTPEGASVCAQELLEQEQVLILVGGEGSQDGALLPAVASADTILWSTGGSHAAALTDERSYLLLPILVANWGVPQLLPDDIQSIAYVSADTALAREGRERTIAFFPPDVTIEKVNVPYTATDFQPYCLSVKQAGAEAVMASFNPQQMPTMMQTCAQLGLRDLVWVVPSPVISPEILDVMDELGLENRSVQGFQSSAYEGLAADNEEFGDEVGEISNLVADQSVATWLGVKLLPDLIAGAGAVDGAAIRAWLDQQTALDTGGATPPIDFTASPVPTLPRIKNVTPWGGEWTDSGVDTEDEPLEIDLSKMAG